MEKGTSDFQASLRRNSQSWYLPLTGLARVGSDEL